MTRYNIFVAGILKNPEVQQKRRSRKLKKISYNESNSTDKSPFSPVISPQGQRDLETSDSSSFRKIRKINK